VASTIAEEELAEIYAPHEGSFDAGPGEKKMTNPNGSEKTRASV
jgi:hypothetical protein